MKAIVTDDDAPFVIAAVSAQINRFDCDLAHSAGWRAMRGDSIKLLEKLLATFAPDENVSDYIIKSERKYQ